MFIGPTRDLHTDLALIYYTLLVNEGHLTFHFGFKG